MIDRCCVHTTMQTSMMHTYQTSTPAGQGIPSTLRTPQPSACGRFTTASAPLFASPAQPIRRPQRQCSLRVASTSLDDLSLFQSGSAMPSTSGTSGPDAGVKVEDVPLNSEVHTEVTVDLTVHIALRTCKPAAGAPWPQSVRMPVSACGTTRLGCGPAGRVRLRALEGRAGGRRLPEGRRRHAGCADTAGRARRCEAELGVLHRCFA